MGREERITRELQSYDRELYCGKNMEGKLCVFRKGKRDEVYHLDDDVILVYSRPAPHFCFALTHNWRPQGTSVDWGLEPIMKHVRECDLWKRDIVTDLEKQEDEYIAELARNRQTTNEAFFSDFRSQFAKTFSDINTANMEKIDLRKKKEKSKWQL